MSWIVVKRRPSSQYVFFCNSSVCSDNVDEATEFDNEDKAIAAMMGWGLSAEDYFITENAFSDSKGEPST